MEIKEIVKELDKKINTKLSEKVLKKDLKMVVEYWIYNKNFEELKNTKLYTNQSGKYCRLLELLERMNLKRVE